MSYSAFETWRHTVQEQVTLSIVIPACDEAERILSTMAAFALAVSSIGEPWELIVSDGGSQDGTADLIEELGWSNLRVLRHANTGKGGAVRRGMLAARGELLLFADADNSTPIEELPRLIRAVRTGAHIAVGSRAQEGTAEASRSRLRRAVSGTLRALAGQVTGVRVRDTQCGFELFRREVARDLFTRQKLGGFSFDLELLYLAARGSLRVVEVPVHWGDSPDSKVDPVRDSPRFLRDLARLHRLHARHERAGRAAVMPSIGDLADLSSEEGYQALPFVPDDAQSLEGALCRVLSDPRQRRGQLAGGVQPAAV